MIYVATKWSVKKDKNLSVELNTHDIRPGRSKQYLLEDFADTTDGFIMNGAADTSADSSQVQYDML